MPRASAPILSLIAVLLGGCELGRSGTEPADAAPGAPDGAAYEPPRDDLVPAVGSATTLDLATWNIELFPKETYTPRLVADLVASLDLDLIAVQEIADAAAFAELDARLPDHTVVLSSHTYGDGSYQRVGFVYKPGEVTLADPELLFPFDGYAFPRPPLQVRVTVAGAEALDFIAIVVHLKAGRGDDDRARRTRAIELLEAHVAELVAGVDEDVVILGDFNEVLTYDDARAVFAPFLTQPTRYDLRTRALADSGAFTFIPSGALLDHAVTTASLADELAGGQTLIPRLDEQLGSYEDAVSDHLPVVVTLPLAR